MRYVVTGRVHPERADISFSRIEWGTEGGGRISAQCDASQVTVVLDTPQIDGFITAHIAATHFAYLVVAALGFALGSGYSVEIVQVTEADGTPRVMGVRPGSLEFDPNLSVFDRAVRLASDDLFFRLALRDYVRAIADAEDCASYCYRAIEGIKSAFVFRTGDDSWDGMHAALGTERSSIENHIKTYADPVRHGNWAAAKTTTVEVRLRMLKLTRDILAKYLDNERPAV
jgi:hypothetical protein